MPFIFWESLDSQHDRVVIRRHSSLNELRVTTKSNTIGLSHDCLVGAQRLHGQSRLCGITIAPRFLSCLRIKHPVTSSPARLDSRPVANGYLRGFPPTGLGGLARPHLMDDTKS